MSDRAEVTVIAIQVGGLEKTDSIDAAEITKAFNELVVNLDNKGERLDVERLNCFGGTYIATCGLTKPRLDRIKRGVDFANNALNLVKDVNSKYNLSLNLLGLPLITIALGELTERCKRARNPLFKVFSSVRNFLLPPLILWLVLRQFFQVSETAIAMRFLSSCYWLASIYVLLLLVNIISVAIRAREIEIPNLLFQFLRAFVVLFILT